MCSLESEIRCSDWINDSGFTDAERDVLWQAKRILNYRSANQRAFRRAARHHGLRAVNILLAGFHPTTGIIDPYEALRAAREAREAASNAFAAHPELREAA